jgi:hypothetical protein
MLNNQRTFKFCGNELKFKEVPVRLIRKALNELLTSQYTLENESREYLKLSQEVSGLMLKAQEETDEAAKEKLAQLIKEKEEKTVEKEEKLEIQIQESYFNLCDLMFEDFKKEYLENMTTRDMMLIPLLPRIAEMHILNLSDETITQNIEDIIAEASKDSVI